MIIEFIYTFAFNVFYCKRLSGFMILNALIAKIAIVCKGNFFLKSKSK